MNYNVIPTEKFKKEARRLKKKYPSLKDELTDLSNELIINPKVGTSLGHNAFKIRVAIKSKGKGKSGGARVVTYVITESQEVYLLSIYDKAELDTINDTALAGLIGNIKSRA